MTDLDRKPDDHEVGIALPNEVFADIIINFLGHKESISYEKNGYFIIDLQGLKQFYFLLDEKIAKEQFTHIKLFKTSIIYDDDTSRHINSIESLDSYFETKAVTPVSITLTWSIVLQFPNSKTIETQKIELTFHISDKVIDGNVLLNISHTNQSWGNEVQSLFINQIKKITSNESRLIQAANSVSNRINFFFMFSLSLAIVGIILVGVFVLLSAGFNSTGILSKKDPQPQLFHRYEVTKYIANSEISNNELMLLLNAVNTYTDNQLEDYANNSIEGAELREFIKLHLANIKSEQIKEEKNKQNHLDIMSYITLCILALTVLIKLYLALYVRYHKKKSFILITDEANNKYKLFNETKNKVASKAAGTLIVSIVCGIIANFVYSKLVG